MPVNPVAGAAAAAAAPPSATPSQGLRDKDAFLGLLVASLKYQDPSAPMDSSQLMAQTTQLATMEQLTELTRLSQESFALQQWSSAAALVGRSVNHVGADGAPTSGRVESVDLTGPVPAVTVDGRAIPLTSILGVGSAG